MTHHTPSTSFPDLLLLFIQQHTLSRPVSQPSIFPGVKTYWIIIKCRAFKEFVNILIKLKNRINIKLTSFDSLRSNAKLWQFKSAKITQFTTLVSLLAIFAIEIPFKFISYNKSATFILGRLRFILFGFIPILMEPTSAFDKEVDAEKLIILT